MRLSSRSEQCPVHSRQFSYEFHPCAHDLAVSFDLTPDNACGPYIAEQCLPRRTCSRIFDSARVSINCKTHRGIRMRGGIGRGAKAVFRMNTECLQALLNRIRQISMTLFHVLPSCGLNGFIKSRLRDRYGYWFQMPESLTSSFSEYDSRIQSNWWDNRCTYTTDLALNEETDIVNIILTSL